MTVLVTGASGLVGRRLCETLVRQGKAVRTVVRQTGLALPNVQQVGLGDLYGGTDWQAVLNGVDTVVHLAARVHVMHDTSADPLAAFRRVNVEATLNLARQAADAGVRRLVFVSSVKVNGEASHPGRPLTELDAAAPQDPYAVSKWEAEQGLLHLARSTGLQVVIIRPPLVYGPGVGANFAALARAVSRGWPLPLGAVHNRRSLVALDNLVDLIVVCLAHPGAANQIFFVSDGQDLSTAELVRGLAQAAGVGVRLLPVPTGLLMLLGRAVARASSVQRLCGDLQIDITKARQILGWQPVVTTEEGFRMVYEDKQGL